MMDEIGGVIFFDAEYRDGGQSSYTLVVNDAYDDGLIALASDNNDAEWQAACFALETARKRGWQRFVCIGDSKLVIDRASGGFRPVDDPHYKYRDAAMRCKDLSVGLDIRWFRMSSRSNPAGREIRRGQARDAYGRRKLRPA